MWLTAGRYATKFQAALATRFGLQHCGLTVSGSSANRLVFTALTSWELYGCRIAPGSEVIRVAAGFPTTVAPIVQNDRTPVLVDVDFAAVYANVDKLAAAVGPKTRASMLAHTRQSDLLVPLLLGQALTQRAAGGRLPEKRLH